LLPPLNDTAERPEDAMTPTHSQIETLVMQMQSAFLDDPTLALTLGAARRRFGVDEITCAGVLDALVDARVLTRRAGVYRRSFPAMRPAA
jgi:hypothetical protein